jgi:hypothetical protein
MAGDAIALGVVGKLERVGTRGGVGGPGTAAKSSLAQRLNVAASGNPRLGDSGTSPSAVSPVGVGIVMILADFDVIEETNGIIGQHRQ